MWQWEGGCPSGPSASSGLQLSGIFFPGFKGFLLFPAVLLQAVLENGSSIIFSWMGFAELEGSAGAEVSSPPLRLCRLSW